VPVRAVDQPVVIGAVHMRHRAGPPPLGRVTYQAGSRRVEFHVAQRFPLVGFVERTRVEPVLPDVPRLLPPEIEPPGVIVVRSAEGVGQPGFSGGDNQEVHVIPHQAVAGDPDGVPVAVVA